MNDYGPQETAPVIPERYAQYSQAIPKVLNLLLVAMAISNFFLLLSVGGATLLPNLGINTLLVTLLLCFQNGFTLYVLNSSKLPHNLQAIPASDFMIGVLLGVSTGGAILSFVLSHYYGQLASCVTIRTDNYTYQCDHPGKMLFIWFWAGITFWLELAIAILIVIGKEDIAFSAQSQQYEDIGLPVDINNTFQGFMPESGRIFGSWSGHQQVGEAQIGQPPQAEETQPFQATEGLRPDQTGVPHVLQV